MDRACEFPVAAQTGGAAGTGAGTGTGTGNAGANNGSTGAGAGANNGNAGAGTGNANNNASPGTGTGANNGTGNANTSPANNGNTAPGQSGTQTNAAQTNAAQTTNSTQNTLPLGQYTPQVIGSDRRATIVGPNVFDLGTAIHIALQTSSGLEIANRNLDRDAARIQELQANDRPQVNASGTYTHLDSPVKIQFGAGPPVLVQPENTETLTANAQLPIDVSGQVRNTTDAARLQLLADRFTRDSIYDNLVLNTQTSYFNVLRSQHQLQVAQAALADAQT